MERAHPDHDLATIIATREAKEEALPRQKKPRANASYPPPSKEPDR